MREQTQPAISFIGTEKPEPAETESAEPYKTLLETAIEPAPDSLPKVDSYTP
ncbi:MAG: hypothetical protein LUJ25_04620 [Firmicutes bacterium]|nr:hypothetical protein [Bacillota bacterium]